MQQGKHFYCSSKLFSSEKICDIRFISINIGFSIDHIHTFYFNPLAITDVWFLLWKYFSSHFLHAILVVISSVVSFWFSEVSYTQVLAIWMKKKKIKNPSFIKPNHLTSSKQSQFVSFFSYLGDTLFNSCSVGNIWGFFVWLVFCFVLGFFCQDSLFKLNWIHKVFHSFHRPAKVQGI